VIPEELVEQTIAERVAAVHGVKSLEGHLAGSLRDRLPS
jgi:hypothetical protein